MSRYAKQLRYGAPFFALVLGGPLILQYFQQIKYDYNKITKVDKKDLEKLGIAMKDHSEVTLESEFEKLQTIDTETWENKRGPRPWEEGNVLYQEALERAKKIEQTKTLKT